MKRSLIIYVILAIAVTLGTLYYQHATGPTYEKDVTVSINGNEYDFGLTRSHDNTTPCFIKLIVPDQEVRAHIKFRRFPTNEEFREKEFTRDGDTLMVELPNQPMAGKLQYAIEAYTDNEKADVSQGLVVVRFKGHVPLWVLRIHIFLMFASYFFAIFAGLLAIFNQRKYKFYTVVSVVLLSIGGLILGPIVQKYAFDVWWSGFPLGMDLTDNKLLIAVVVWIIAWILNRKKNRRWWVVAAMVVNIAVYSIPHSAMGSEFDYESGTIGTSEKFKD